MPDEYKEFYEEAIEDGSGFKCVKVANHYDFKSSLNAVVADHDNERRFVKELVKSENAEHIVAWLKSTPMSFYEIDYFWKKGEHPKRGKFSPDFFIKSGDLILVAEIKEDDEIKSVYNTNSTFLPRQISMDFFKVLEMERLQISVLRWMLN